MKSQRQLQIGETLKRLMSEIFLREDILTIPGSYITVLEADVSPDAKNVKIFIDIFGNEKIHDEIVKQLNSAMPHFRYQLAKKVVLRVMPEMVFVLDKTQRNVARIEDLIASENAKYDQPAKKSLAVKRPRSPAKEAASTKKTRRK